jgi:hypothetical protein
LCRAIEGPMMGIPAVMVWMLVTGLYLAAKGNDA